MAWGSDVAAQMLRRLGIRYVSLNPGASYRGLHDSLVNHLGNERPGILLCLHEDHSVAIAHGYAKATGKPPEIIAKMVEGRVRKYYGEVVLLEQVFVIDNETKVSKVIEDAAKSIGAPVKLTAFVRYALGEGIEKRQEDFAAEVAAAIKH